MPYTRVIGLLTTGLLAAGASMAQIKYADLHDEAGDCGDRFGTSVAICGDLALIGAPSHVWCGDGQGFAVLLDVTTGENLEVLQPSTLSPVEFGRAVAMSPEYMVVCGLFGSVVYDTTTRQPLHTLDQPAEVVAVFGSLAVLGCPYEDCGPNVSCGAAYIYDLATGQELHRLTSTSPFQWEEFGRAVAIHGDHVAVGVQGEYDPGNGYLGKVHVFDASSGQRLYALETQIPLGEIQNEFGQAVALRGNRLLVGAPHEFEPFIGNVGAVYVYETQTGQELGKIESPSAGQGGLFGSRLAMSDGRVLIVDKGPDAAYLFDVETRQELYRVDFTELGVGDEGFGRAIALGESRALISDPTSGTHDVGVVPAVLFEPPVGSAYCSPAVPNSTGLPARIRTHGSEAAEDDLLLLTADQLPPSQFGYFLSGPTQGFVPNPGGSKGNLCLGGTIGRYTAELFDSGPDGSHSLFLHLDEVPFPGGNHAIQAGETWNWTCWYRDDDPTSTPNFTDAVSILFQ